MSFSWNVVPWYIGSDTKIRAATSSDLQEARPALTELLSLLPDLRVVILFGKSAAAAWEQSGVKLRTIRAPHPSPRNLNGRPQYRSVILNALLQARWEAGLTSHPPTQTTAAVPSTQPNPRPRSNRPPEPRSGRDVEHVVAPDPSRETIRALLLDGQTADQIAVRYNRRRGPWLIAIEEEAKLDGEFNVVAPTPKNVVALRDTQRLRWERIRSCKSWRSHGRLHLPVNSTTKREGRVRPNAPTPGKVGATPAWITSSSH